MRKLVPIITLTTLLLCTASALAGAILRVFTAKSSNGDILLEWSVGEEKDLLRYEVQRMAGVQGEYVTIATVNPKGSNSSYEFLDKSAYKLNDSIYKYRLAIVSSDGMTYSQELTVPHTVSGVKQTWGSIKAMFR
jgi:hypothetical protein